MKNIYDFTVVNLQGENVSLSKYRGKALLIVNTASACGLTPQYAELESLHQEFKDNGFSVIAFPSNDFASQEPLDGIAIQEFCDLKYKTTFPVFDKVHVLGSKTCDLYKFLSSKKENGNISSTPKWNFHKYLIDSEGNVVNYFLPITSPLAGRVKKAIRDILPTNK